MEPENIEPRGNLEDQLDYLDKDYKPTVEIPMSEIRIIKKPRKQPKPIEEKSKDRIDIETTGWFEDEYKIKRCIGAGATGYAFSAEKQGINGIEKCIIKVPTKPKDEDSIEHENKILFKLGQFGVLGQHENLIKVLGSYKTAIVMPFLKPFNPATEKAKTRKISRTITDMLIQSEEKIHDEMVALIAYGMFNGIEFMHQKGIVHRDLKPGNVLYNGQAVIYDFGAAIDMGWFKDPVDFACKYKDLLTPDYVVKQYIEEREKWDELDKGDEEMENEFPHINISYLKDKKFQQEFFSTFRRREIVSAGLTFYNFLTGYPPYGIPGKPEQSYLDGVTDPREQIRIVREKESYNKNALSGKTQHEEFWLDMFETCFNPKNYEPNKKDGKIYNWNLPAKMKRRLKSEFPHIAYLK